MNAHKFFLAVQNKMLPLKHILASSLLSVRGVVVAIFDLKNKGREFYPMYLQSSG